VLYCAGWYVAATPARTVDETRELVQALNSARQKYQRPSHLGEIEITIAPREPLTSETIDAYSAIGVSRLLLRLGNNRGMNEAEEDIRRFAPAIST
jgi:hypothetical protein